VQRIFPHARETTIRRDVEDEVRRRAIDGLQPLEQRCRSTMLVV
jgi:hypothetical protein